MIFFLVSTTQVAIAASALTIICIALIVFAYLVLKHPEKNVQEALFFRRQGFFKDLEDEGIAVSEAGDILITEKALAELSFEILELDEEEWDLWWLDSEEYHDWACEQGFTSLGVFLNDESLYYLPTEKIDSSHVLSNYFTEEI